MKTALVEIKSSDRVTDEHLKHLKAISADEGDIEAYCFCRERRSRKTGDVLIVPWQEGFQRLGL